KEPRGQAREKEDAPVARRDLKNCDHLDPEANGKSGEPESKINPPTVCMLLISKADFCKPDFSIRSIQ
ncbi:MAG: hypothetical protein AAF566_06665, partial [Pseudomonadota bacterium]